MSIEYEHFEINEMSNLIDNLEMVSHFLESTIPYKWKWGAIALHQALYGALITMLMGTDPRQTVVDRTKDSGRAVMLHVHKIPIETIAIILDKSDGTVRDLITNPHLISLDEALRRAKITKYLPSLVNAQPLTTTTEENDAIHALTKEFRNEFEHFKPKGWVVFTHGMPSIFKNVSRVIRFLVFESNCVTLSSEQRSRLELALERINQNLIS